MGQTREVFLVQKCSASCVQATTRRLRDFHHFNAVLVARAVLATYAKRPLPRRLLLAQYQAETCLAARMRMCLARNVHVEVVQASVVLETAARRQLEQARFVEHWTMVLWSARLLQAKSRRAPPRSWFQKQRASVGWLQAPVRRLLAQEAYIARHQAAYFLLCNVRQKLARDLFASQQLASSQLKSECVRVGLRREFARMHVAAVQLQACARQCVSFSAPAVLLRSLSVSQSRCKCASMLCPNAEKYTFK